MGTTRRGVTRWELILAAALACTLWWLTRPRQPQRGDPAPPDSLCRLHLKEIALALHGYHQEHGSFPPVHVVDETDSPVHSWRTLLLPHLDEEELYNDYDFSAPWNAPENKALSKLLLKRARHPCPLNANYRRPGGPTHYLAVVGPHTAWRTDRTVSLDEITDGADRTILVVEVANSDVNWFEPRDLEWDKLSFKLNDLALMSPSSKHVQEGGWFGEPIPYVNVLLVDGSVRKLPVDTTPEVVKAMLTIDGGETFDPPWLD